MKIGKVFLVLTIGVTSIGGAYLYYGEHNKVALPSFINTHTTHKKYIVKKAGRIIASADTQEEAIEKASKFKRSIAINTYNGEWVYSDFNPFLIITEDAIHDFDSLIEAIQYAKNNKYERIYYKNEKQVIWELEPQIEEGIILDVPLIRQLPELPRGCEVTSLAMIMKYAGINIDKMTLAKEVKKETYPYKKENGKIEAGNPYNGFVGDMYNKSNFGYGGYHEPIVELAQQYCGNRVVDLTGLPFEEVIYILQKGYPVWIITNITYRPLDDSKFQIWHTPTGIVKITYSLHSVVITGAKEGKIYINDPLSSVKNISCGIEEFQKAWEQMGNQAVVILD